jgi:hypothetical protein
MGGTTTHYSKHKNVNIEIIKNFPNTRKQEQVVTLNHIHIRSLQKEFSQIIVEKD